MQKDILIKETVRAGGAAMLRVLKKNMAVSEKEGRGNYVTEGDLESEREIVRHIHKYYPSDTILSEESVNTIPDVNDVDRLWIIDPIDGTHNYRHNRSMSCVSVAYAEKGEVLLGAVYNPFINELFFAEKGNGAYCNDTKLSVAKKSSLDQASIQTNPSYDPQISKYHIDLALRIQPTPWISIFGSGVLAMCYVAAGRDDLYFHTQHHEWDNAAAMLLISEAGGVVKGFDGKPATFSSSQIVVGYSKLVNAFLKLVNTEKI